MNLLITDHTQNAHSLLDRQNQKKPVSGIDVKSIHDIAREIVIHDLSSQGKITEIREPKRLACAYMIQTIMERLNEKGKLLYFVDKNKKPIDDFSTCEEIYRKLNEIRLGKTTDAYEETDDPKILTLKAILKEFEKELRKENDYDSTRFLLEASDKKKIESWKKDNPDVTVWKYVFSKKLPDQTKLFLKRLKADDFDAYCRKETGHSVTFTEGGKHICSFAKAYGISNEVADIVKQIQEKQIPYGDVSVYYPNQDYEAYLDAEFASRNVPLTFASGRNPKGSEYFRIARGILKWAQGGFYYDQLRSVFSSSILKHEKNSSPGYWYEKEMEAGIGFGLSRYYGYADAIQKQFEEHHLEGKTEEDLKDKEDLKDDLNLFQRKNLADYLKGLADVFKGNPDSAKIYRNLIQWLDEFTRKSGPDKERSAYLSLLKDQIPEMDLVHITDLKESCDFLLDELDHLRISDPDRPDAVRAIRVNQYRVENRKHVWFIGLSVNEIESAKTDSPVLTDAELKQYLKNPVNLASEYAQNMRESLYDTLASVDGGVRLTYTYYETNTLLDWNPSSFYLDLLDEKKETEDHIAPPDDFNKSISFEGFMKPVNPETDLLKNWLTTVNPKNNQQNAFSASSAQTLLTCHLEFYYQYILGIKEPEEAKLNYDEWLGGKYRGNLFHKVLERYVKKCLMTDPQATEFDQDTFEAIFQEEIRNAEVTHTCLNERVKEAETEEYRDILTRYLKNLHEECNEEGWHVGGAEYETDTYAIDDAYPLIRFNGKIDRYDWKKEDDGSITYRIVDYKTSRRQKLEEELKNKLRIQHQIYMELLKKDEEKSGKPIGKDSLYFEYTLIYEDPDNAEPIRENYSQSYTSSIAKKLNEIVDDFESSMTKDDKNCQYCPYQKLCGRYGKK